MKQNNFLKIAILFVFAMITNFSYGQDILTFEFSALSGSEVTASSNSNDDNIGSSTISRGDGLNASNNSGRFNATNWATGSIDNAISGNDYMEFTITPNVTFQFSVSSIEINLQRSGTGPRAIALRNSLDGYATNLDSEKTITDNSSTQSFTFTFSQANSAVAITYRVYMYAEGTGGSGGIGDFTGNDIVVNGAVSSASTDTKVSFVSATSSVSENGTSIDICASISNPDATNATTVEIALDGASTASNPGDYTPASAFPVTLTFPPGSSANQCLTLNITNDAITEPSKTVVLNLQNPAGGNTAGLGVISQNTLTILDDDIPNIIITEIMYNSSGTDDEWLELYNNNGTDVDVSGYKLIYNGSTFLFPVSTTFTNGTYITIAVGSDGNAPFNPDNGFTPDFNNLAVSNANVATTSNTNNLGNTSGTIEFRNANDVLIDTVDYDDGDVASTDGVGPSYEIIDNTSDNALTSVNWQASAINGGSPKRISGTVWTGATSSDWLAGNFSNGLPTSTSDVSIPSDLTFYPTVSSSITVNVLNIESGATLIATNTFSATVNYNRDLANGNQWYLMSSPVTGVALSAAWASENSLPTSTLDTGNLGISWYNNTSEDTDTDGIDTNDSATGHWRYLESNDSNSSTFSNGKGYGIIRSDLGAISFTGTGIYTSTQTTAITQGASNSYNLVGNPFTSYLNLGDFFADNPKTTVLAETNAYFYNGSSYITKNLTNTTYEIAPGQGFFVEAATDTNLTFDISDTNHLADTAEGSDTFQKNSRPEVHLFLNEGNNTRYANMYYIDGTTTGFDSGYDGKLFGGITHKLAIYTHLVNDDQGIKYQLQSLPNSNHENMIVPVGVIADSGKEITFTVEALNLPSELKVFLEDRQTNSYTRLDEANATYKVTLDEALNGVGRFFLHTSANKSTLNIDAVALDNISIYNTNNSNLRIVGLSQGKATVKLFNILGKQVLNTTFTSNGLKDISLPNLSSGVYIVQLETETGKLNKKITLE